VFLPELTEKLIEYDKQLVVQRYKFGVLYCKEGQTDENEMYSNGTHPLSLFTADIGCAVETSKEYEEFLDFLGERIVLKGWTSYRGGLDVKSEFSILYDPSYSLINR
jgi:RAP1 GTPase activating protein 1